MTDEVLAGPHSLRSIEKSLRMLLRARGRLDLEREALARLAYTDDGSTIYIHILPRPEWSRGRPGRAYVLAFADARDLRRLSDWRALRRDARLLLQDEIDDIIRWFDAG